LRPSNFFSLWLDTTVPIIFPNCMVYPACSALLWTESGQSA
jgi:hypothetical protein